MLCVALAHCCSSQDLFDMCAPEFQPAILALKKAILKWAGSDQAGAVQLVSGRQDRAARCSFTMSQYNTINSVCHVPQAPS
jgi:hypothetical protein